MKKVLIIGGGFGGLSAASLLAGHKSVLDVTLIDRKETFDFLPMLPDIIGRGINPGYLACRIKDIADKTGFNFIGDEVISLDLEKKEISASSAKLNYDYLLIASGSQTNFYGNDAIRKTAYTLDSVYDAQKISRALREYEFSNVIISGGGYTGIETAAAVSLFLNRNNRNDRVIIVERTPEILGLLPEWMRYFTLNNLKRLNVEVLTNSVIDKAEGDKISLSNGGVLEKSMLIWVAGVMTADFIQDLKVDKNPQGRIKVDEYLRMNDSCFVSGDAAYFAYGNSFLRMAVQFSIFQGRCAAINIIRSIKGDSLLKYRPVDLGYIIPMANNNSCGRVLGMDLRGFLPTLLHFCMCVYRSCGIRNKIGIIKQLRDTL